jgi:effector-binding domain-containing protein
MISRMGYAVRVEEVGPRALAVVRGSATRASLGPTIIQLLDQVWPVLRAQGLATDHNVVVYKGGIRDIEVGVEVVGGQLVETEVVKRSHTPAGPVATVSHFGAYTAVGAAYVALERYCEEHHLARTPISWEVYGDWSDNPAELRMDVYWLLEAARRT